VRIQSLARASAILDVIAGRDVVAGHRRHRLNKTTAYHSVETLVPSASPSGSATATAGLGLSNLGPPRRAPPPDRHARPARRSARALSKETVNPGCPFRLDAMTSRAWRALTACAHRLCRLAPSVDGPAGDDRLLDPARRQRPSRPAAGRDHPRDSRIAARGSPLGAR
jgi:hypothetical protein